MYKEVLFTIGHSNRSIDDFVALLGMSNVTAVADVRSQPFSRHLQHFNREHLSDTLRQRNIAYVFLGKELGARRDEDCCYIQGKAKYELIEKTRAFQVGLDRIRKGALHHRVALMCAEKDPLTCHRSILIAKVLRHEFDIRHIVSQDQIDSHHELERRLLHNWQLDANDLFLGDAERLEDAYRMQAQGIEYKVQNASETPEVNRSND
jgi:uncharacterized protein (DUF488 family)